MVENNNTFPSIFDHKFIFLVQVGKILLGLICLHEIEFLKIHGKIDSNK